DGSRGRWIAVAVGHDGAYHSAHLADTLAEVLDRYSTAPVFAIDVPIGLPETGARKADLEAKMLLGPRRSTVFAVPPRPVLVCDTYADARKKAVELTGKSISAQAFALRHNVLEAESLLDDERVFEVHPELAFRSLVGRVLTTNKRTWNGAVERQEALASAGITLPARLGDAGDAPVDDILDAAVCAWVARRIAVGESERVPAEPELDLTGRPVAIHF
ncbi:MAG: DUF429 domain-containing protein, partial [Planctomycetota bacterium]